MRKTKMMIVIRKDLNMRKGKMVAQGSHAVLGVVLKYKWRFLFSILSYNSNPISIWLKNSFTKICVSVNSEDELLKIESLVKMYNHVFVMKIPYYLIKDAGHTEFHGIPTYTCMAIGPWWSDDLDDITGNLKLL